LAVPKKPREKTIAAFANLRNDCGKFLKLICNPNLFTFIGL
jgi:hypothetical protein